MKQQIEGHLQEYKKLTNKDLAQKAYELADIAIKLEEENTNTQEQLMSHAKLILAVGVLRQRGVTLAI